MHRCIRRPPRIRLRGSARGAPWRGRAKRVGGGSHQGLEPKRYRISLLPGVASTQVRCIPAGQACAVKLGLSDARLFDETLIAAAKLAPLSAECLMWISPASVQTT